MDEAFRCRPSRGSLSEIQGWTMANVFVSNLTSFAICSILKRRCRLFRYLTHMENDDGALGKIYMRTSHW